MMTKFPSIEYPEHVKKLASRIAHDLRLLVDNLPCDYEVSPAQPLKVKLAGEKLVVKLMRSDDGKTLLQAWKLPSGKVSVSPL
jgi:hypothetical protein